MIKKNIFIISLLTFSFVKASYVPSTYDSNVAKCNNTKHQPLILCAPLYSRYLRSQLLGISEREREIVRKNPVLLLDMEKILLTYLGELLQHDVARTTMQKMVIREERYNDFSSFNERASLPKQKNYFKNNNRVDRQCQTQVNKPIHQARKYNDGRRRNYRRNQ